MEKQEIYKKIVDKAVEMYDAEQEQLRPETEWADLGIDSLDFVEFIIALEKEFNINISDAQMEKMRTVNLAVDVISNLI